MSAQLTPTPSMEEPVFVQMWGSLDEAALRRAASSLEGAAIRSRHVVLDVSRVAAIDLSAIDQVLETVTFLHEHGVAVHVTPAWADDVLHLTGSWPAGRPA